MADTREPSPRSSQVYRGGQPEEDKDDKTKTPGDVLAESGEYLKDPETEVDTSKPLESRMFDIDPKKHKQAGKIEKIYTKVTDPQAQGSEKEWIKKTGAQLPNVYQVTDPQAKALGPYDQAMREAEKLTGREKVDAINEANKLRPNFPQEQAEAIFNSYGAQLREPSKQLEFFNDLAAFGGAVLSIGLGMLTELNRLGRI